MLIKLQDRPKKKSRLRRTLSVLSTVFTIIATIVGAAVIGISVGGYASEKFIKTMGIEKPYVIPAPRYSI